MYSAGLKTTVRLLLAAIIGLSVLALPAGSVQAHASLVRSTPSRGEVLSQFPVTVDLVYSEAVDPGSVRVQLFDAAGQPAAQAQVSVDPSDPTRVTAAMPTQPDGIYSLEWRVTSSVDGHSTRGVIAFSVGAGAPQASLLPPPGTPDPTTATPSLPEVLLRALSYLSVSLIFGAALFGLLVWRPAVQSLADRPAGWDQRMTGWLRRAMQVGVGIIVASMLGLLVWQAVLAGNEPGAAAFGTRLLESLNPRTAYLFISRLPLLLVLFLLTNELPQLDSRSPAAWWGAALCGAILALTFAMSGHIAALGQPLAVAADWLHLAGMAAWIGGLLPLGLLLLATRREKEPAANTLASRAVWRFSRLAMTAVVVLALTGLYSAWVQIRTLDALTGTRYGQAVLLKTVLFAILVGFGALNQLGILPRLAHSSLQAARDLSRTVRIEYGLGLALFVVVGILMSVQPGLDALQVKQRMGFHERYRSPDAQIDLRIAPASVGENEFGVDFVDLRPGAGELDPEVLLRVRRAPSAASPPGDVTQVETAHAAANRYTARGSYFSQIGIWQVEVILRKAGYNDIRHTFLVDLPALAQARGERINPQPATRQSIEAGQALYGEYCAPCHGVSGRGDGPSGLTLQPPPSDLTQHAIAGVHTDGELFEWISSGFPNSAMPAFEDYLTEEQRWNLVNFIRTLTE